jgi:O-antigen/teichoic acid export membrane protein
MTIIRSILTNMLLLTIGRVTVAAIMLLTTAFLTRHLGLEGFGHYRTAIAYLAFATALGNFGLYLIGLRELSRKGADQSRILGNALGLRAVTSVAFLALSVFLAWILPFAPQVQVGIAFGAAGFAALSLHQQLTGLFQQRLRQGGLVLSEIVGASSTLGLAWFLAGRGADVVAFIAATAAAHALTLIVSWGFARRLLKFRLRVEWKVWRSMLIPACSVALGNMLMLLYYRSDTVFLAILRPAEEVGLYGAASRVSDTVIGFALMFVGLVVPLLSKHAHDEPIVFCTYLQDSFDAVMLGAVGTAVVLYGFAGEIVTLIAGPSFAAAAAPLRVLCILIVVGSSSMLLRQAAVAIDAQKQMIWGYGTAAAVSLITYPLLIHFAGGVGAAWGLVLGESIVWAYGIVLLARRSGAWVLSYNTLRLVLSGAIAVVISMLLVPVIGFWPLRMLMVAASFAGLTLALGGIRHDAVLRVLREIRR